MIGDGGENASKITQTQLERELIELGIRLCALLILEPLAIRLRMPEEGRSGAFLGLAKATGGDSFPRDLGWKLSTSSAGPVPLPREVDNISTAATALAAELSQFYSLQIRLPEALKKGSNWQLEVMESTGQKQSRVRVVYPHKLAACP